MNKHPSLNVDLSRTTKIPEHILSKMEDVSELLISNYVYEKAILQERQDIPIDIGIGTLTLEIDNIKKEITYDFIPSASLEKKLIQTLAEEVDLLEESLIQNLSDKVVAVYKEFV